MMTVRSSRSLLSLIVAAIVLAGCGRPEVLVTHKCQLLVVLDKTNSVSYVRKRPHIQDELLRRFNGTYGGATKDIASWLLVITGNTNVFAVPARFGEDRPIGEEDSREQQQKVQRWNTEKRIWLADRVKDIGSLIDSPCGSNRTDIFSIFNGIGQVQKEGRPGDSVTVIIFSDMVNTSGPINMLNKGLSVDNAREKGKAICSAMMKRGEVSGTENLDLTIYTPDEMENSGVVKLFWDGFFEQWGLKPEQYHFE